MYLGYIFLLVQFVKDYPGAAAWMLGGLLTLLGTLIGGYWLLLRKQLAELAAVDKDLTSRIESLERQLAAEEGSQKTMNESVKSYMDQCREQNVLLRKSLEDLSKSLSDIQFENVKAHSDIIQGRIGLIERVASLEAKTNGGVGEIVMLMREMTKDQDRRYHEQSRDPETRVRPSRKRAKK